MRVVIIGATSAIAQETARRFARDGAALFLVGRDQAKLMAVAADLEVRGAARVETLVTDLADRARHPAIATGTGDELDVVLIAHADFPDQKAIDHDPAAQARSFDLSATSAISLAAHFADVLERRGHGVLAVIGSVAGDRGRAANYTYGAAKAALHAYCEGLRGRLRGTGVRVLLIKPGRVDTPMTASMPKGPLFASAAQVGKGIYHAILAGRDTVYLPWYWRWISLIVRTLPERMLRF
jgi:short-subunit dehydrogenase